VDEGLALTLDPVVALRPVAGLHVYVVAPLAVNVVLLPVHIDGEAALAVTAGLVFTVITCVVFPEPLALLAVSVTV
jgi:hypothetical protein